MNDEIQEIRYLVGEAWKGTYSPTTPYGNANVVQDPTGLSVYRSLKPGNVGHPLTDTNWWFCIINLSSIKAESDRIAALNQAIAQDEALRVAAEELRQQKEAEREAAETQRNEAEQNRISAEQQRVSAEQQRASQEQTRISQEQSRVTAEQGRVAAEAQRVQKEQLRENSEAQRVINETNRVAAEAERVAQYTADHQQAVADHDQYVIDNAQLTELVERADADHTQAVTDHTTAAADHTQAGNDHTRAESDHSTAAADHTQAGADHTRAESDHTRAESDHAAVEVYVDSLGVFDLSKHNAEGGVLATYADLSAALTALNALESKYKYGGMSFKFVQSSDNKYVQYFLTKDEWSLSEADWVKQATTNDVIIAEQGAEKPSLSLSNNGNYVSGYLQMKQGQTFTFLLESGSAQSAVEIILIKEDGTYGTRFGINRGSTSDSIASENYIGFRYGAQGVNTVTVSLKYSINDKINAVRTSLETQLSQISLEVTDISQEKVDIAFDNILDKSDITNGSAFNATGVILTNPSWNNVRGLIVLPWRGQQYITCNYCGGRDGCYIVQFDKNMQFISGSAETGEGTLTFERYSNESNYIGITFFDMTGDLLNKNIRACYGTTLTDDNSKPNPIKEYIKPLETALSSQPVELYAFGNGDDSTPDDATHFYGWKNGKCAWQRAIDAADGITQTLIYCKGQIKITASNQFTQQEDTLYNVVFIPSTKNNIQLIGESPEKTSLVVEMPDDFGSSNIATHQPMGIYGNNSVVKNMTITGKNCRYCVHVDATAHNIGDADNHNITFENMVLRHYENVSQSYNTAFAGCASDGMILTAKRCKFIQEDTYTPCLYTHDNKDYEGGGILRFIDCTIENSKTNGVPIALFQMLGSGTENIIEFQNMDFGSNLPIIYCENNNSLSKPIDKFVANNHFSIKGCVDSPIGYLTRESKSRVLRITSKSTGSSSKVRFDKTSSAFDVLIKGNYNTDYTENTGIVHIDGYHYRDGADVLKGYAMGEIALDINTDASIQKRLGDCSSSNKALVVSVDDVDYTITFNADYTNYSDADMLAVFTSVLGSVADVELYNWGADYFPELNSNIIWKRNSSTEAILVGMGVRERGSQISKAVSDDAIHGVALDDIPPSCYGRVAKKAYLSIYEDARHHICLETYPVRNTSDFYSYRGFFGIGTIPGVFVVKQTETPVYGFDKGGIDNYLAINK